MRVLSVGWHLVWRRLCVLEEKRVLDFLFNVFKPLVSNSFYFEKNPYYCYVFIVSLKLCLVSIIFSFGVIWKFCFSLKWF